MRQYNKGNYDNILKKLNNYDNYRSIKINDYSLLFFLISEQNKEMINKLLKLNYKDKIIHDNDNPVNLFNFELFDHLLYSTKCPLLILPSSITNLK